MAAPSPPRRSAAWRAEALCFCDFPVVCAIQFELYLRRCLTQHHQVPCYRETTYTQFCRPHDTLSCLFHAAIWLGRCQSKTQQSNEPDMVCYKIPPLGSITCSQVGPMSLEWPVAPTGGLDQSSLFAVAGGRKW